MENETTLPGILTVPGELLQPAAGRSGKRRYRGFLAGLALLAVLAAAWIFMR